MYLYEILEEKDESKKKKSNIQDIKRNIKKYFKNKMDLKALPPPSGDEDVLTCIEEKSHMLSEKFLNKMGAVVETIRKEAEIKTIMSQRLNSQVPLDTMSFFYYCNSLINQLNEQSKIIELPSTFDFVVQQKIYSKKVFVNMKTK